MSILGPLVIAGANTAASLWTNEQNIKQSDKQMRFQERMRDTEISARIADLQRNNLNPMLAYMGSASSPQGSRAEIQNPGESATRGFSAAMAARQMEAQTNNIKADTALKLSQVPANIEAQTQASLATAGQARATEAEIRARIPKIQEEISQIRTHTDLYRQQARIAKMDADKLRELLPHLIKAGEAQAKKQTFGGETAEAMSTLEKELYTSLRDLLRRLNENPDGINSAQAAKDGESAIREWLRKHRSPDALRNHNEMEAGPQ